MPGIAIYIAQRLALGIDTYVSTCSGAAVSESITLPLVAALETAWSAIQHRHRDVPDVVLTLGAGSIGERGALRLGHFAAARWQHGEAERLPELFVGGEGLQRTPAEILGTLLHEAAHGVAHVRSISRVAPARCRGPLRTVRAARDRADRR